MKKLFTLLALLALLIACAPQKETGAKEVAEEISKQSELLQEQTTPIVEPAERTKEETPPQQTTIITPPIQQTTTTPPTPQTITQNTVTVESPQQMDPQLRDLLKRADEKLQSMQYLYGGTSTNNLFLDTYFVKKNNIKIKKYSEDYYVREDYYDTIYVTESTGCCEEPSRCESHNVDNRRKAFAIDNSTLVIPKTPYQWAKEIPPTAKVVGPQTFNTRSVTYVTYEKDGNTVEMLIDETYGVPHRVLIKDQNGNTIKHQFNDLKFNGLKDTNFVPPCK